MGHDVWPENAGDQPEPPRGRRPLEQGQGRQGGPGGEGHRARALPDGLIESGYEIADPSALVKRVYSLMSKELGVDADAPLKEVELPEEEEEAEEDDDKEDEEGEEEKDSEDKDPEEKTEL